MKTIKFTLTALIIALSGISFSYASGYTDKTEKDLHPDMRLEQWMMVIAEFDTGFENEMTFESWMMSQASFMESENRSEEEIMNFDKELQFEDWMLHFSVINFEFQENELQLETWMTEIN